MQITSCLSYGLNELKKLIQMQKLLNKVWEEKKMNNKMHIVSEEFINEKTGEKVNGLTLKLMDK